MFSLRPFRKMGKLTKLLYLFTTSETDKTTCENVRLFALSYKWIANDLIFAVGPGGTFNSVLRGELFAVVLEV